MRASTIRQTGATLLVLLLTTSSVSAEHAKITLDAIAPGGQQTAFVDQTPPAYGKNPRPVLEAKVGETIKFNWTLQNVYPNKTLKDVVVHFYVVAIKKVGQRDEPDFSGPDVVVESAFEMDFRPGAKAAQRNTVKFDKAGVYLVRVETRGTDSDHEHFSAIDVVIKSE